MRNSPPKVLCAPAILREFGVEGEIVWFTVLNAEPTTWTAHRFALTAAHFFTAQAAKTELTGDMGVTKGNMVFTEEADPS